MRIVNENVATRRLTFREREDGDPRGEVAEETVVEFDRAGRAEVAEEVGEALVSRYPTVREADGPEDVAEGAAPWDVARVLGRATDRAAELAREAGLKPSEVEGTGKDGRITAGDVRDAASSSEEG